MLARSRARAVAPARATPRVMPRSRAAASAPSSVSSRHRLCLRVGAQHVVAVAGKEHALGHCLGRLVGRHRAGLGERDGESLVTGRGTSERGGRVAQPGGVQSRRIADADCHHHRAAAPTELSGSSREHRRSLTHRGRRGRGPAPTARRRWMSPTHRSLSRRSATALAAATEARRDGGVKACVEAPAASSSAMDRCPPDAGDLNVLPPRPPKSDCGAVRRPTKWGGHHLFGRRRYASRAARGSARRIESAPGRPRTSTDLPQLRERARGTDDRNAPMASQTGLD